MRDTSMVLFYVCDRIEAGSGEVANVEIHSEPVGSVQSFLEAFRRREFVRILGVTMPMHGDRNLVFLSERLQAGQHADLRRRGDGLRFQSLRLLEALVQFSIREILGEVERISEYLYSAARKF